jgi:hypothetical protein
MALVEDNIVKNTEFAFFFFKREHAKCKQQEPGRVENGKA